MSFFVEALQRAADLNRYAASNLKAMTALQQYQLVRVKQLDQPVLQYDGWRVNKRPPSIGDVGTLVDILRADGLTDRFVVECCEADGATVWLADFNQSELEQLADVQPSNPDRAHLLFLRSGRVLLVKRSDVDWRQLQDDYSDYMASLGPWTGDEIVSYFTDDYTDDDSKWPFSRKAIRQFFDSLDVDELSAE